jgi:ubiquinone/menaquinone biosynthesis C-methylase UbiE
VDFRDEMFDAVQLWHVLEHLSRERGNTALREIHRILKPYGQLDIEVPDMDQIAQAWVSGDYSKVELQQWIYGEDLGDGADYHRYGWDAQTLQDELVAEGFRITHAPETGLAIRFICERVAI